MVRRCCPIEWGETGFFPSFDAAVNEVEVERQGGIVCGKFERGLKGSRNFFPNFSPQKDAPARSPAGSSGIRIRSCRSRSCL